MNNRKLWIGFILVIVISFGVLLYYGNEIYRKAPPVPEKIVTEDGELFLTQQEIYDGQNIWQSIGGHQIGSVWGHGAYQAPDWTAEWLHKEAIFMLNQMAQDTYGKSYKELEERHQASLRARLQGDIRTNTYNEETGTITISSLRAKAFEHNSDHYRGLFMDRDTEAFRELREAYGIPPNTIKSEERMFKMNAFFFWATWATVTERPGKDITYTNNWPPEDLVGNKPTSSLILWTGFSVILLLLGIGLLSWYYIAHSRDETKEKIPDENPLLSTRSTPSMKATLKYFYIVSALILVQILMGVITAHYGVEGHAFYGLPLAEIMPYSISRTWHVQLAIFWIATSWLATGLYFAPALSGKEPKGQKLGVNILFIALLIVVVGSLAGQWMGVMQKLGLAENFWFGHMGYEYVDLGRFWQILLFVGLFLWLFLMGRAIMPALRQRNERRQLLLMFVVASIAIALFYGAALMWGQETNLAVAEYWR